VENLFISITVSSQDFVVSFNVANCE
jgi:hypothetical protein